MEGSARSSSRASSGASDDLDPDNYPAAVANEADEMFSPELLASLAELRLDDPDSIEGVAHRRFDWSIAELEALVHSDAFAGRQRQFLLEHCGEFDDGEENKLIYTEIFGKYLLEIETYIIAHLKSKVPSFDLEEFMEILEERHLEVSSDVLDVLASMSDFEAFKALILAVRHEEDDLDERLEEALLNFYSADPIVPDAAGSSSSSDSSGSGSSSASSSSPSSTVLSAQSASTSDGAGAGSRGGASAARGPPR
eukprot:RCo044845